MHRSLFFLMLLLASCQEVKEVPPDIPCHLRYPHTCKPSVVIEGTKPEVKFLGNQQLNTLTHYLAMQEQVESQTIGFSGSFSEVYQGYEALQGRIKALNDGGRRVADYHLAKAQCWLDVSFHEYTRNDRSNFPQAAMTESERLIVGMERDLNPMPLDTPLVNGAVRLRDQTRTRRSRFEEEARG